MRLHAGAEPRLEEERMDVTQGKLALGFRTGGITCWEEDYPALVMCQRRLRGHPSVQAVFERAGEALFVLLRPAPTWRR